MKPLINNYRIMEQFSKNELDEIRDALDHYISYYEGTGKIGAYSVEYKKEILNKINKKID